MTSPPPLETVTAATPVQCTVYIVLGTKLLQFVVRGPVYTDERGEGVKKSSLDFFFELWPEQNKMMLSAFLNTVLSGR